MLATATMIVWFATGLSLGAQISDQSTSTEFHYKGFTFLSATSTNATSTNSTDSLGMDIKGAKKIVAYFSHGGTATTSTGGARFRLQVSPNQTDWYDLDRLLGSDVSQTATSSVTIQGATSTTMVKADIQFGTWERLRCVSSRLSFPLGVDGEQTCTAYAEY